MLYSRNNYNIGVRSRRQFLVNELITCAASRAGLRLVDGLIRPEKLLVATASLKNGNGLFHVNYERIDRVLINLNEPALLCCEGEDVCAGSVPEHADLIYVKDVGVEGGSEAKTKQMARYLTYNNASEVLDSVYRASSLAENCLHRLVDSLAERSVLEECKAQLEELEVNGVFLFPFVPFASCADLELRLSKIDANFVQNITITLSNLGALIFVLQQFAVLFGELQVSGHRPAGLIRHLREPDGDLRHGKERVEQLPQNYSRLFRRMPGYHVGMNRGRCACQPQIDGAHAILKAVAGTILRPENVAMPPGGRAAVELPEFDERIRPDRTQFRMDRAEQFVKRLFHGAEIPSGGIVSLHRIVSADQVNLIDEIELQPGETVIRHESAANLGKVFPNLRKPRIENPEGAVFQQELSPESFVDDGTLSADERESDPEEAFQTRLPASLDETRQIGEFARFGPPLSGHGHLVVAAVSGTLPAVVENEGFHPGGSREREFLLQFLLRNALLILIPGGVDRKKGRRRNRSGGITFRLPRG